jgi:antitoxin ParD1/3/4
MRTNIDIDDAVLQAAMKAGSFRTKKEAVEAGLRLLARQAVYRELLALQGKLVWDEDAAEGDLPLGVEEAVAAKVAEARKPPKPAAAKVAKPRPGAKPRKAKA